MPDVPMPRLSDSMEEGTVLQWLKQVGDEVAAGEPLVEIETDKANMVYEADVAGTLGEILVAAGETAPVGAVIARIGSGGATAEGREAGSAGPVTAGDPPSPAVAKAASGMVPPTVPPTDPASDARLTNGAGSAPRVKASPVARRLAKERGVDLASLQGSGPGGRIVKKDVAAAVSAVGGAGAGVPRGAQDAQHPSTVGVAPVTGPAAETAKGKVTLQELSKLQQVVSRRMSESKATAPHFYLEADVDTTAAVEARQRLKRLAAADGPPPPTFNDMVVKACALALRRFPKANGSYRDGALELYSRVNVGVAVAATDALVVPTVFDADRKGLREIAAESRRLAAAVKDGSITPPELAGGTFTVSNLGMFGVSSFAAVVNSPQAAILAVGELAPKPVAVGGAVEIRQTMRVTLSCDHRILYGAEGAQFLAAIRQTLEEPISLAL